MSLCPTCRRSQNKNQTENKIKTKNKERKKKKNEKRGGERSSSFSRAALLFTSCLSKAGAQRLSPQADTKRSVLPKDNSVVVF